MEKSFWIRALQEKLSKHPDLLEEYNRHNMCLYLFGSATQKQCPRDLDIVILYYYGDLKTAQTIRDHTVLYLKTVFEISIDCVLLSFKENEQVCFTLKEKAELVFPIV